jgi:hypothetical protein
METEQTETVLATPRHFNTRDTRLRGPEDKPTVIKSVDLTERFRRPKGRTLRLDYGFGGDGRLYVEVAVYKPRTHVHWTHHVLKVEPLPPTRRRPENLKLLAKALRVSQKFLIDQIMEHAPKSN